MRKVISISGLVVLFACSAAAQDVPRFETFAGYTYTRANSATNVPAFSMNGGSGQFVYNFNHYLGAVADIGAVNNSKIGSYSGDTTLMNFLFGPRVAVRKWNRFTPYAQMLWGGVYATTSTQIQAIPVVTPLQVFLPGQNFTTPIPGQPITARLNTSQTAFAMSLGGGLDIKITKHISFRPIQLEWYMTRLQNLRTQGDNNQNNLRYSTGVNFTFGAQ